ncbi:MAG: DUF2335 domain-containing protein [Rickettsiales bacterium]
MREQRSRNYREQNYEIRSHNILPAPSILESYEEIAPGSVDKIMEMAKAEQEHRHSWENRYLKSMAYTTRVGQLLGFALAIILIYTCLIIAMDGNETLASVIAFSGFAFLMIAALASARSRRHIARPRRHFDPDRQ